MPVVLIPVAIVVLIMFGISAWLGAETDDE